NVGYEWQWFIWECERLTSNNIWERLDKRVSIPGWKYLFPTYSLKHCGHSILDHCPLLLNTCSGMASHGNFYQGFKFEAAWILEESCEGEVGRLWEMLKDRFLTDLGRLEGDDETLEELIITKMQLNLEIDKGERYREQRARTNWLRNGTREWELMLLNKSFARISQICLPPKSE
ncbi:hypothetical protein Golob_012174, partial [Gossypium lobatum]|nr:hypothetical protein [Gossypium lobatum]